MDSDNSESDLFIVIEAATSAAMIVRKTELGSLDRESPQTRSLIEMMQATSLMRTTLADKMELQHKY